MARETDNDIADYLREGAPKIASLTARVATMEATLEKFEKIVTDGNGQPSVLVIIANLRIDVDNLCGDLDAAYKQIKELESEVKKRKSENKTLWVTILVGLIAAASGIVAAWISK